MIMRRLFWMLPALALALTACSTGPDGRLRSTLGHTVLGKPKPEIVAPVHELERCAAFHELMAAEAGSGDRAELNAGQARLLATAAELARLQTREEGWDGVPWRRERLAEELAARRADGTAGAWIAETSAQCEEVLAKVRSATNTAG